MRRWRPRVLSAAASLGLPAAGNLAILEGEWRAGAAAIGSGADGAEAASRLAVGLVLGFAGRWSAAARDRSDGWAREVAGPHWARLERLSRQALAATGALLAAAKGRGFGPVARLGILQVVEGELRSKHFAPAGGAAIDALRLPEVPPDLRRMLRGPPAGILDRLIELRDRAAREVLRPEETSAGEEDAAATEEVLRLSFDPAEGLLPLVLTAPRGDPPAEIRARISPGAGA
ncbi:MAG: hypothetical protein MUE73_08385 [Planctomycetes bacterium]|nr:hypothetical protein [Planctomycetota bacterium]